MDSREYYATQSKITDPGKYAHYFYDLPDDIALLSEIVRGLVLHHNDGEVLGIEIPRNRLHELELRYVGFMLDKLIKINNSSFIYQRNFAQRIVGCCRDFSLLLCAILRYKNIPARIRVGFSTFHVPGFHHDQVLLEYWNSSCQKWCLVDARMSFELIQKHKFKCDFDWCDIPRDKFLTAAEAWILCRNELKNPNRFGTGYLKRLMGWWYIRNKLIQDMAALNKKELLLWDCWGMMLKDSNNQFMANRAIVERLDYFAELLYEPDTNFEEIKLVYHLDSEVKVPHTIYSAGLVNGEKWVQLSA